MQYKLPYRNNDIQIPHTHVTDHSDDCLLQVASNDVPNSLQSTV